MPLLGPPASEPWIPEDQVVRTSDHLLYEVAKDGDAYFSVSSPWADDEAVLIRVSSQALTKTTQFFAAQFGAHWIPESGKFTTQNPLVFSENFVDFVTFLHIASEDGVVPAAAIYILKPVAVLLDKYLFKGTLPVWCEHLLMDYFSGIFPFYNDVILCRQVADDTGDLPVPSLPFVLQCAYFLNLPVAFAIASRRMMWQMTVDEVRAFLADEFHPRLYVDFAELLQFDYVECFEQEAVRLRTDLVSKLPTVFQPDPHGERAWWCSRCQHVPQTERWHREVISKSQGWNHEQGRGLEYSLDTLFEEYISDMTRLETFRDLASGGEPALPCGRFRPRYCDIADREMLWDVYSAIGGLCLPCVKAGEFKFCSFCPKHNLDLTVERSPNEVNWENARENGWQP
ncbi:uncharacterized protein Z519_01086 [Cladophialophora bantiana CBS 173.52]|uniref:Uncharacterized protein n=1 Tax=Cladophialophora bantiana (strain ATCC 10958 / CBS 173.52 / CDC B-1940 / NIH 8579) TaxID=1442370 RepID=A0A0D2GGR0_CLAB1|nr:uncharacterized protein Z519_01086 [Cladophialophora bantiana CBS 173.52]KIW97502.1 hypothetical protein Z519_01086 [Cladophialophora bantiana CBS 173.52]